MNSSRLQNAHGAMQLAIQAQALGLAAHGEGRFPLAGVGPPEIKTRATQHEHRHSQPSDDFAAEAAGDENLAVQIVEEAYPAGHRLLRLEKLQRHRIDQDLQATGERALHRHATLRLISALSLVSILSRSTLCAATELRAFVRHAGPRQPHCRRLTD